MLFKDLVKVLLWAIAGILLTALGVDEENIILIGLGLLIVVGSIDETITILKD